MQELYNAYDKAFVKLLMCWPHNIQIWYSKELQTAQCQAGIKILRLSFLKHSVVKCLNLLNKLYSS